MDWDYIIQEDSLVTNPPALLAELRLVLRFLAMGKAREIHESLEKGFLLS